MAVEALVSVEEYLATSYDPDLEYVDGRLVERNVGEPDHGRLQLLIADALRAFEKLRGVRVFVETRLLVAGTEGNRRASRPARDVHVPPIPLQVIP